MQNECVVTFKNQDRQIAMYFTLEDENLDMQMSVNPEFKDGDEPDLPMLLANLFIKAVRVDEKENEQSIITS